MMTFKKAHKVLLILVLLMLAALTHQAAAQAKNGLCCCASAPCNCCCNSHDSQRQETMLPVAAQAPAGNCSCSSDSNPFRSDEASATPCVEPGKKRLIHLAAAFTPILRSTPTASPAMMDKPPPRPIQRLYLLKNCLLI